MCTCIKSVALILCFTGIPVVSNCAEAIGSQGTAESVAAVQKNLDIVWTLLGGVLVFLMQAGFALVEAGFTRAKVAANIMMKNTLDFVLGTLTFFIVGFGLMFGSSVGGFIGIDGFAVSANYGAADWNWTFLFFQTMFAATAATIVSGAMAERIKFSSYLVYSLMVSMIIYPISGKWGWGGLIGEQAAKGWLEQLPTGAFCDFAGSSVVHSVGGWLALAGAIILGPRIGKFGVDGKVRPIPGHNLVIGTLGVLLLWVGWFGFNAASTNLADGSISRIAFVTNLGGVSGCLVAMCAAWKMFGKPELSMTMNGALAGLVSVTAGCNTITPFGALVIGSVAGLLVVLSVVFWDRHHVDDPVGAVSVHAVNGLWGTLACGLFNAEAVLGTAEKSTGVFYGGGINQLISQMIGAGSYFVWAFGCGLIMFWIIKHTMGLRVSREEELKGLDISEHGNDAYSGFQIFSNQ